MANFDKKGDGVCELKKAVPLIAAIAMVPSTEICRLTDIFVHVLKWDADSLDNQKSQKWSLPEIVSPKSRGIS